MTFSASISISPSEVLTVHLLGPVKVAHPFTNSTPAPFNKASTPLFKRSTIESFQEISDAISRTGSDDIEIPICPFSELCFESDSNLSAACIMALLGMQPLIRQVPPDLSPSTTMVSRPS